VIIRFAADRDAIVLGRGLLWDFSVLPIGTLNMNTMIRGSKLKCIALCVILLCLYSSADGHNMDEDEDVQIATNKKGQHVTGTSLTLGEELKDEHESFERAKTRRRRRRQPTRAPTKAPTRAPTKDNVVNQTPEGYIGTCNDNQSNRKEKHAKPKTADECRPLCAEYDYFMIEADLDCACYDVNPCAGRRSGNDIAYYTVLAAPAPTEAPTKAPSQECTAVPLSGLGFVKITSGTCASHGKLPITSPDECNQAAAAIGMERTNSQILKKTGTPRPEGCYTQNGFLYIAVDPANIGNGVDIDCRCPICKDDSTSYRSEM